MEIAAGRAEGQDVEALARCRHETAEPRDVQRAAQLGLTEDAELIELGAESGACDLQMQCALLRLDIVTVDQQNAGCSAAGRTGPDFSAVDDVGGDRANT